MGGIVGGGISCIILYTTFNKLLYDRINPIYKVIYKLKRAKKETAPAFVNNHEISKKNIIDQVEKDVIEWAKERNDEIEQLKSTEAFRREYIGNVSHELKTPIFNAQGFIYTLLDGGINDEKIKVSYLEKAGANIERLQNIVQDLEIISSLETGEIEMEMSTYCIQDTVEDLVQEFQVNASDKNITLKLGSGYEPKINVLADIDRINQVLTNLISNSIKYGKEDGTTKISFYNMETYVLIEIEDNGIGMSEEHQSRIFERFYRVDKGRSRHKGGTGLGLSIVKHILEQHNQTIEVRSKQGEGTTFSFALDIA